MLFRIEFKALGSKAKQSIKPACVPGMIHSGNDEFDSGETARNEGGIYIGNK